MPTKDTRPTRSRNQDGQLRQKRGDTLLKTIRKKYGDDVAAGTRSDAKLSTVLKKEKVDSLSDLLKKR